MNNQVAQWLYQNREHLLNSVGYTPAELLFEFLSDPTLLNEYHDFQYHVSEDGCNYVFKRGNLAGQRCNREKCLFHDHVIFSTEYQMEVQKLHHDINKEAAPESDLPIEIKVQIFGQERYIDPVHKLILETLRDKVICVGYIPVKGEDIRPLTQELIDYCDSIRISYIPDNT